MALEAIVPLTALFLGILVSWGFALALLAVAPRNRLHLALGLLLTLLSLASVTIGVRRMEAVCGCLGALAAGFAAFGPVLHLAAPWATVGFALRYRAEEGLGASGKWRAALLAGFLAMLAVYASRPALFWSTDALGPLAFLSFWLLTFSLASVSLLLGSAALRLPPGPRRTSLWTASTGFALFPAFYPVLFWIPGLMGAPLVAAPAFTLAAAPLVVLLARAGAAAGADAAARVAARRLLAAVALAAGSGGVPALAIAWGDRSAAGTLASALNGLWFAGIPVLVGIALLRHQLFGLDVKVRWTVQQSTVAAAFVGLYVVVSQATQRALEPAVGPLLGLVAAGLLVLAIAPLQRHAARFARVVVPLPPDLRNLDVYRSAAAKVYAGGGEPTPRERTLLAQLRSELGITDREHAVLEQAIRAGTLESPAARASPGALLLGHFRVVQALGEGSHGAAYLVEDTLLRRQVVIKALRGDRSEDPAVLREARAVAAVRHPRVVTIHAVEQVGAQAYIVMEHLEGGSLEARLQRGPLLAAEFQGVAEDVLAALDAVHAAGLVHRDVKPSNILLTREGRAKLADFGIAHVPGLETTRGGATTATGALGTVRYMSPEQARGRRCTPQSDLYSAAATLYEAHTGRPYLEPLPDESAVELQMRAAAARGFDRPLEGPPALRAWFAQALDPSPARRFLTAAAMAIALARALDLSPTGIASTGPSR